MLDDGYWILNVWRGTIRAKKHTVMNCNCECLLLDGEKVYYAIK